MQPHLSVTSTSIVAVPLSIDSIALPRTVLGGYNETPLALTLSAFMAYLGVAKRILFRMDRQALAAPAVEVFASFEAKHPPLKNSYMRVLPVTCVAGSNPLVVVGVPELRYTPHPRYQLSSEDDGR